jgi:hypothetical protein
MGRARKDKLVHDDESHESSSPKGLADVILLVLEQPGKLFLAGGLLLVCTAFLLLFLGAFKWMFGIGDAEWELSAKGPEIYFESKSGEKRYQFTVQPQGWQRTSLHLKAGDILSFQAIGKVNVDAGELIDKQQKRLALESEMVKRFHIDVASSDVPENHYSDAQMNELKLDRAWNDPNGQMINYKPAFSGRQNNRLMPGAPVGMLLGTISSKSSDSEPENLSAMFRIGNSLPSYVVENEGELWFTVNDIKGPPRYPDLFYVDNLGFFQVTVTVTSQHPWWRLWH